MEIYGGAFAYARPILLSNIGRIYLYFHAIWGLLVRCFSWKI